MISYLSTIHYL